MPRRGLFTTPSLKVGKAPRIFVRARKIGRRALPTYEIIAPRPGMNIPETMVANALEALKISYEAQSSFGGGSITGGGRMDFKLPAYRIDLEYAGPFHGTGEGAARDLLRNQLLISQGWRVVTLYERDLPRLKPRILEVIGRAI